MHFKPWILYEKVACPHFQQFLHCCSLDGNDVLFYVEASINEYFGVAPTLNVPYVDPHNRHVGFG